MRDGRGVGFFNLFFDVGGVVGFFVDEDRWGWMVLSQHNCVVCFCGI